MVRKIVVAKKITIFTIVINIILAIIKVVAGVISNSSAVIADGIHSFSDVATTIVAYIGIKLSGKEDDEDHQYGHEKLEPIMNKILALMLIGTAVGIIFKGYNDIISKDVKIISNLAMYAAIISIVVKEWMYQYTIKAAKLIKSSLLKTDAWHHRTDAFSSIAVLIGVIGASRGIIILEPLATIVVGILIIKIAVKIYIKSASELMDKAAPKDVIEEIRKIVLGVEDVKRIDLLKTRVHGSKLYVDLEILLDGELSLYEAHDIAERVHDNLENQMDIIKHCMVHVNPK